MNFHEGDSVMHWTYGLGKVVRLEERALFGQKTMYYAVQIRDMTVWVPADGMLESRLRPPTFETEFKALINILSGPAEHLPADHHERKLLLLQWLKNGRADSLFRVIRSLFAYRKVHHLNENDQAILKRSQNALTGEWGFALSITPAQAELDLQRLLTTESAGE